MSFIKEFMDMNDPNISNEIIQAMIKKDIKIDNDLLKFNLRERKFGRGLIE